MSQTLNFNEANELLIRTKESPTKTCLLMIEQGDTFEQLREVLGRIFTPFCHNLKLKINNVFKHGLRLNLVPVTLIFAEQKMRL